MRGQAVNMRAKSETKTRRSGGWYFSGVTTGQLEIETLKSLI
jgi:hypothetical protein